MVGFENDDSMDLPESENIQDRLAAFSKDIEDLQSAVNENREVLHSLYFILKTLRRSMLWYYSPIRSVLCVLIIHSVVQEHVFFRTGENLFPAEQVLV